MWAPITPDAGEGGTTNSDWVQIGNRAGGICRKHSSFYGGVQPDECSHYNWCNTQQQAIWKTIYACCDDTDASAGAGPIHLTDVSCSGSETLGECSLSTDTQSCDHSNDVAVSCTPQVRITGGATILSGRVEIKYRGNWQTPRLRSRRPGLLCSRQPSRRPDRRRIRRPGLLCSRRPSRRPGLRLDLLPGLRRGPRPSRSRRAMTTVKPGLERGRRGTNVTIATVPTSA
jgi:hypothetical protein